MITKLLRLNITKYFIISCLASVIDFSISYLFYKAIGFNYLVACNSGIISGFIFQYYTCTKYIFKQSKFLNSLIIYIVTFFIGFALADATMWVSYNKLNFTFFLSKIFSMVIPFSIIYGIRKSLLGLKKAPKEII